MSDPHNTTGALEPVEQGAVTRRTDAPSPLHAIMSNAQQLADMPLDKIERIYELHSKQQFAQSFSAVQRDMTPVPLDGYNPQTRSKFSTYPTMMGMLKPLLQRHGLTASVSSRACDEPETSRFVLTIRHDDTGYVEEHTLDAPIDYKGLKGTPNKTKLHGTGSSYKYCARKLMENVFLVISSDDDDDGVAAGVRSPAATPDQCANIRTLLADIGRTEADFCKSRMVERIEDLPKGAAESALRQLERMARS